MSKRFKTEWLEDANRYQVLHISNGKCIGDIYQEVGGEWAYIPPVTSGSFGFYDLLELTILIREVERENGQ